MKAIVRESAYADLERIRTWIENDRPVAARRVIDLILENIERLARFPLMGRAGRVAGTLEWVVPSLPYIVVYTVNPRDDEIAIIAVFHGAQQRPITSARPRLRRR
jgi:toxin ParE1/3/4